MVNSENAPIRLIDVVDEDTRKSFKALAAHLRSIKSEIEIQLISLDENNPEDAEKAVKLKGFDEAVDAATSQINLLQNRPIGEGVTPDEILESGQEQLSSLKKLIDKNISIFAEMKDRLRNL